MSKIDIKILVIKNYHINQNNLVTKIKEKLLQIQIRHRQVHLFCY
jgi:hypothetical protein